jgi:predicted XRE-type DNA-binding protein
MSDVWDDLADTPSEAAIMRGRAELLSWAQRHMDAAALGLTGDRYRELMDNKIARFTVEDLIDVVTRLGGKVVVSVERFM